MKGITRRTVIMPSYYVADRVDTIRQDDKIRFDTIYHQVGDFHLTNQLGHPVDTGSISGKVVLADFFFTSCPSICPQMTANLLKVQKAFAQNDSALQILSFTVDPLHDSVPRLKAYADRYHVNHDTWWFLTGDREQIYNLARHQFFVVVTGGDDGGADFIHTQKWVLLDKHRFIRGYYDGLDSNDIKRCVNDIALLMLEKEKR